MKKTALICFLLLILSFSGLTCITNASVYTITHIASAGNYGQFGSFGDGISMNDFGTVAFYASTRDGNQGIYTANGQTLNRIYEGAGAGDFNTLGPQPTINNNGYVAYMANVNNQGRAIYMSNGTTTTTLIEPGRFQVVSNAIINDNNSIAFKGLSDHWENYMYSNSVLTGIGNNGTLSDFNNLNSILYSGNGGLLRYNNGNVSMIASGQDFNMGNYGFDINNKNKTVFAGVPWATTPPGKMINNIYINNGIGNTLLIDCTSGNGPFYDILKQPGINDNGQIAFVAMLTSGKYGLFAGSNPTTDAVTMDFWSYEGNIVINNKGQIAFTSYIPGIGYTIYRADPSPVPIPNSIMLLGSGIIGIAGIRSFFKNGRV